MNTNNNTPRLDPPKVIFEGKEALLKPMIHKSTIWIKVSSLAASIILIVGLAIFWPIEQKLPTKSLTDKTVSPVTTTTTTPLQSSETFTSTPSEPKIRAKEHKSAIKDNKSTSTSRTKQEDSTQIINEVKDQSISSPKITKHESQTLIALIEPTLINVQVATNTPSIDIQAQTNKTKLNINKFRSITIFEEIKKSIIEQVLSTPAKMGLMAQDKIDSYIQGDNQQDDYIL